MGVYVKEQNQPWNHKQIAGNATGDNALDATSSNNIQNKVATAKFTEVDNKITTVNTKLSGTKKYTGLVTSNLVVAANGGTATFSVGSTSYNSFEIMYYGYSGWRQFVAVPAGTNVGIPLHVNATTMASFAIKSPVDGVVTITNNTSQQLTITRIYGVVFQ